MSLFPTVYRSTDPGAPALTGQVGSLAALLDAVLVDGYGVGVDAKAPAGWSREFSAANKRVYRPNPISSSGYFLHLDDTATTGNARHAWMRAYESMSGVDTGINPVPTTSQFVSGAFVPKSSTLDGVARPWTVIANERFVYLVVNVNSGIGVWVQAFGDLLSYKPGDMHAFVLACWPGSTAWTGGGVSSTWWAGVPFNGFLSTPYLYVARSHTGDVGAVGASIVTVNGGSAGLGGVPGPAYPDRVNGGLLYEFAVVTTAAYTPRGELPGLVLPVSKVLFDNDTYLEGVAGFEGERLLALRFSITQLASTNNSLVAQLLFRVDKEWT